MKGFTLIELLVTTSIMVIMMAIAVPSFNGLMNRNRLATSTNDLVTALNLARSEAVKRSSEVRVLADGAGWASGWTVATGDINQDGDVLDTGENVSLRLFEALSGNETLATLSADTSVIFNSDGTVETEQCFTLTVNGSSNQINVARTGHISSDTGSCS